MAVNDAVRPATRPAVQGAQPAPKQMVRKAVFPAAGLGTRMLPATKAQPKEMLNVVDRPLIQYGVQEAVDSGISQIILVTAAGKTALEDHFDTPAALVRLLQKKGDTETLEAMYRVDHLAQVAAVRQREALGLGHAVGAAAPLVGDEPFCVFLPDDIIVNPDDPCMAQLLRVYQRYHCPIIAVERVPRQDAYKYGIVAVREVEPRLFQVLDMVEKPAAGGAPSDLAIMGRYVLTPAVFDALERTPPGAGGEIQLTDALRLMLPSSPVYAYEYQGRRYDCGSKLGYLRATVELALERPDLGEEFRAVLQRALNPA